MPDTRNDLLEQILTAINAGGGVLPADNCRIGLFDYNDSATATTPISVTGGAGFVKLTNNELGAFTNKLYPPTGVTDVWNATTDQFDWSDLKLGDMIDIRLDVEVTTTGPNQNIDIELFMAVGASEYAIPFENIVVKSTGAFNVNRYNGVYMGDAGTLNNPAELRIKSDGDCTVVVRGWYCKVLVRGA